MIKIATIILTMTILVSGNTVTNDKLAGANGAATQTSYTLEEMLEYALEDERLAQAEYQAILDTFDVTKPFSNIIKAEVKHEEALIELYDIRNLDLPEFDTEKYIIIPDTLEEIYAIGIEAEIKNIEMYERFLQEELDEDVRLVFEALRDGSIKHLSAFEKNNESQITSEANKANGQKQNGSSNNGRGKGGSKN